jgi:hypothetical protein
MNNMNIGNSINIRNIHLVIAQHGWIDNFIDDDVASLTFRILERS